MKNKRKNFIIIAVILFAGILLFFSPKVSKAISKSSTFSYVKNNQTELTEAANKIISGDAGYSYNHDKYIVYYFAASPKPIVEFVGYSFGIAPSVFYTGFYYSPENIPVRFQGSGTAMEPYKNGWAYIEMGNQGYTQKICDNWYWFEFYF
ncbi:MAG: hypothetical protein E7483_06605 [Ruminococcaceae bacterium]|nr:hypothetical protein [Oscillospiraceae bacterium]